MWIDETLDKQIYERAKALCADGEKLADNKRSNEAILKFQEALSLLPEPKNQWLAATWILTAIGDTALSKNDLPGATEAFRQLALGNGWFENPFIRLRRGQIAYENGDLDLASKELAAAFRLGGYDIFDSVDDKYPKFALSKMSPPDPPVDHRLACFHMQNEEPVTEKDKQEKPWWKIW